MLYDVTAQLIQQGTRRFRRMTVTVDAISGDDAAAQAQVRVVSDKGEDEVYQIVSVQPSDVQAPTAAVEGDDADAVETDERAALIQRAIDEGIAIDRRWGVARLREAIAAAQVPA